jgi:hypothetical protein
MLVRRPRRRDVPLLLLLMLADNIAEPAVGPLTRLLLLLLRLLVV